MSINNQIKKPLSTAFYIRVSTEEQAEMFGIDLQRDTLDNLVKAKTRNPDGSIALLPPKPEHIYIDEDISGTIALEERPAFSKLQEDILNAPQGEKPFDIVFVYKLDRLARRLRILLDANAFFNDKGIEFVSAHESIDTSTPFGRAMLGIIGVIAELELETIKERTHAGRKASAKQGVYMSDPPFGYSKNNDKKLIIDVENAKTVERIFDLFVNKGMSKQGIANSLKEEGIIIPRFTKTKKAPSSTRNPINFWHSSTIDKILRDETYIGNYYYDKSKGKKLLPKEEWKLSEYRHDPIIDEYTFNKAQTILESTKINSRIKNSDKHLYLLSSLIKCGCCYNPETFIQGMVTWHGEPKKLNNGSVIYSYKCRHKNKTKSATQCASLPMPAKEFENLIVDYVIKLLSNPKAVYDYQIQLKSSKVEKSNLKKDLSHFLKLYNAIPEKIKRATELYKVDSKNYTLKEYQKDVSELEEKKKSYENRINEIKQKLSEVTLSQDYLESIELFSDKYLDKLKNIKTNREEIYTILHLLIKEIVIYTRPVVDTDTIAGMKKDNQEIPNKIDIKLKLPEQLIEHLALEMEEQYLKEYEIPLRKSLKESKIKNQFEVEKSTW